MHFKCFRTLRKVCFVAYGNGYILPPGKASMCLMVSSILEADVQKRLRQEFSYLFRARQQHPAYQSCRVWTFSSPHSWCSSVLVNLFLYIPFLCWQLCVLVFSPLHWHDLSHCSRALIECREPFLYCFSHMAWCLCTERNSLLGLSNHSLAV